MRRRCDDVVMDGDGRELETGVLKHGMSKSDAK
jgi:hypothetical protein